MIKIDLNKTVKATDLIRTVNKTFEEMRKDLGYWIHRNYVNYKEVNDIPSKKVETSRKITIEKGGTIWEELIHMFSTNTNKWSITSYIEIGKKYDSLDLYVYRWGWSLNEKKSKKKWGDYDYFVERLRANLS